MPFASRYPLNIPGRFYVDDQCTDCDLCRECAPDNIRRDDRFGHYYVYKQPVNEEEVEAVMEGVEGCPTEAVRDDGDQFDWATEPMVDWNAVMERFDRDVRFELSVPVIPYEETLREEQRMEERRVLVIHLKDPAAGGSESSAAADQPRSLMHLLVLNYGWVFLCASAIMVVIGWYIRGRNELANTGLWPAKKNA